jgi:hypothetical protein
MHRDESEISRTIGSAYLCGNWVALRCAWCLRCSWRQVCERHRPRIAVVALALGDARLRRPREPARGGPTSGKSAVHLRRKSAMSRAEIHVLDRFVLRPHAPRSLQPTGSVLWRFLDTNVSPGRNVVPHIRRARMNACTIEGRRVACCRPAHCPSPYSSRGRSATTCLRAGAARGRAEPSEEIHEQCRPREPARPEPAPGQRVVVLAEAELGDRSRQRAHDPVALALVAQ